MFIIVPLHVHGQVTCFSFRIDKFGFRFSVYIGGEFHSLGFQGLHEWWPIFKNYFESEGSIWWEFYKTKNHPWNHSIKEFVLIENKNVWPFDIILLLCFPKRLNYRFATKNHLSVNYESKSNSSNST